MAIATYHELRAAAGPISEQRIKLARAFGQQNLFLSHSHADSGQVVPALGLLEKHGASVYVDIDDASLTTLSGPDLADRLRGAIKRCGRLVVLVSEQTHTSRWIPWEMGLADGVAGGRRVALLPLRPDTSASVLWAKQKYFDLYARIEHVVLRGDQAHSWAVRDPAVGKYWRLARWLEITSPGSTRGLR